jgi:hypothetical protein
MKQIGAEIGVNESRVSQLHARAIRRLRDALGQLGLQQVAEMRRALAQPRMLKAELRRRAGQPARPRVVRPYTAKHPATSRAILRMDRPRRATAAAR